MTNLTSEEIKKYVMFANLSYDVASDFNLVCRLGFCEVYPKNYNQSVCRLGF